MNMCSCLSRFSDLNCLWHKRMGPTDEQYLKDIKETLHRNAQTSPLVKEVIRIMKEQNMKNS